MFLTDLSIKRPVIASVMSLVLVIFGSLVFFDIPTNEIPDIDHLILISAPTVARKSYFIYKIRQFFYKRG